MLLRLMGLGESQIAKAKKPKDVGITISGDIEEKMHEAVEFLRHFGTDMTEDDFISLSIDLVAGIRVWEGMRKKYLGVENENGVNIKMTMGRI